MKLTIEISGHYIMYSHTGKDVEQAINNEERINELLEKESILNAIIEKYNVKICKYKDNWAEIEEHYLKNNNNKG